MAKKISKEKKKKSNLSYVLCIIIVILVVVFFATKNLYFVGTEHFIDYLKFETDGYTESVDDAYELVNENGSCSIIMSSKIVDEVNLDSMGEVVEINGVKWSKQVFDNGVNWMSHYKGTFYLIQMFGKDKKTYENSCKKEFEKIKNSFTFMKSE